MAGYTPKEEWSKVLSNLSLFDEVLNTYGDEIISEYGSYKNISGWMIDVILKWLRRKPYYKQMLAGDSESKLSKVDEL